MVSRSLFNRNSGYREKQLTGTRLQPPFPAGQILAAKLSADMIASGQHAKITSIDP